MPIILSGFFCLCKMIITVDSLKSVGLLTESILFETFVFLDFSS